MEVTIDAGCISDAKELASYHLRLLVDFAFFTLFFVLLVDVAEDVDVAFTPI